MRKFEFFFLFIFAVLVVFPIFLHISTTFPRLDTDYDSNLPIYQYMVSYIWQHGTIPSAISVVTAKGIPVLGDPLNSFLNPLLSVPLLLLGTNEGIRISIFLVVLLSGITMWFLVRKYKVNRVLSFFASFLYMSSGTLVAQIASGHIEKFLVYPFIPFLLFFILDPLIDFYSSLGVGVILASTVYSGDLYATWFFLLFFFITQMYYFLRKKARKIILYFLFSVILFIIFSLLKLYPFLFTVLPEMIRYFPIDPFLGSVHAVLLPLFFIVPFQVSFYDRPFFQHHLGFAFNWYEYFAFISPLPFIFLLKIKKLQHNETIRILILLVLVASLYVAMAYVYSPFHWLVLLLGKFMFFRVPQRIILPLTSVTILLLVLCADVWFRQKNVPKKMIVILCFLSILWTTSIFWQTLFITFPHQTLVKKQTIAFFAKINKEKLPVVTFASEMQFYLVSHMIPIANYYYGWVPKETQTYIKGNSYNFSLLSQTRPVYILATPSASFTSYGYTSIIKNDTITIWKKD